MLCSFQGQTPKTSGTACDSDQILSAGVPSQCSLWIICSSDICQLLFPYKFTNYTLAEWHSIYNKWKLGVEANVTEYNDVTTVQMSSHEQNLNTYYSESFVWHCYSVMSIMYSSTLHKLQWN